jgi:hypothetical protein
LNQDLTPSNTSLGAVDLRLQIQRRVQEDAENSAHFMSMPEPDLSNINKQQKYKYKLGIKKKKAKTITGSTNYKKKKLVVVKKKLENKVV